jgi:signal transduction histidine kinase
VREVRPTPETVETPAVTAPAVAAPVAASPRERPELAVRTAPSPQAVPLRAPVRGLFGLAAAPFIEGDFVAALRRPDGQYTLLAPRAEDFPNAWQRRVLLWFVLSLALVAPVAWGFARRIVRPLQGFADAAEALGRDPSAAILPLDGPAEVGRAAHAFNLMQNRLRAFVDDRTAMVGAISHDLRTPLTRMRFRIEDVPEDQQDGLLEEVAEMEAMITSVLEFIRDASTPGVRERLDLSELVGTVVRDAKMIGGDVTVESTISAPVDVDAVGMRRLLDNLLENAVKYGVRARVQLSTEGGEAIARIVDDGPGIPDDEIERAFEPFYRSASARASEKAGSGLGLAVCRSIARAHGGDVRLLNSAEGFVVQVNVPLAYDGFAAAA